MSGAMIKMGIYGLFRTVGLLGPPSSTVAWALVGLAVVSAVLGALFALAQRDLKRLLAYSSIENVGIICLGLGVGLLGREANSPTLTVLGFAGALLHVLNHALMKSLLFLCAGSVVRATGTRSIDGLGGLLRRMPWTATAFLVGVTAICGLPPLNGFASELLVFLGLLHGGTELPPLPSVQMLVAAAGLALTAGLAAVAFAKAAGIALLGEPRTAGATRARELSVALRAPLFLLVSGCAATGLASPFLVAASAPLLRELALLPESVLREGLALASHSLEGAMIACGVLVALVGLLAVSRRLLLARRDVESALTWDCGYARPTARMQYTGTSFTEPVTRLFRVVLPTRTSGTPPTGLFPSPSSFASETPDTFSVYAFTPVFRALGLAFSKLRWIQHGRLNLYMLYIALALLVLLVWKLR
jgi:formate hydrogenlyase subunit 3/multisubunit Na+/H+ antiporter MnhD subunit